ncbi:hypothetical protein BBP40_004301 [Aspergillus hancockii]|nr:hypothetical protein BBP40_004301 [Aspergillus hancockii]
MKLTPLSYKEALNALPCPVRYKLLMAMWLDLVPGSDGRSLIDTGRLDDIVQGMTHPATQYPSILYFAGNSHRIQALRSLFPQNNITRRGPAGLVRIHLSTATASTEHPILFAESNLYGSSTLGDSSRSRSSPKEHRRYPLQWNETQSLVKLQQRAIAQLILPWTHVLCLFADGDEELRVARTLLDTPNRTVAIGGSPVDAHTLKVVVVLTDPAASYKPELLSDTPDGAGQQSTIVVLDLRGRHGLSRTAVYEPLRRLLLDELQDNRSKRQEQGLLFSASHLSFFWDRTLRDGVTRLPPAAIDCLHIAREILPVSELWKGCLSEFLEQSYRAGCSTEDIHRFVASALLMDAYPPGMHSFRADLVFRELYRASCWAAWKTQADTDADENCEGVLAHFIRLSISMSPIRSSLLLRQENLEDFYARCTTLRGLTTLDMTCNGTSAEDACMEFPALARKIFQRSRMAGSWIFWLLKSTASLMNSNQYDMNLLGDALNKRYNAKAKIFDVTGTSPAGRRVVITTNRVSDGKVCVLANYRGIRRSMSETGYQFLLPRNESENPLLTDVARCCVAAPWYFPSKHLPGIGSLQDGGLRANNPDGIALRESRIIWPLAKAPDLLISVGTGFIPIQKNDDTRPPSILRESAIQRIAVPLWASMDGEEGHKEGLNFLHDPNIHRLNHPLEVLPQLDDADSVVDLAEAPYTVCDEVVRATLATFFFFELDEPPRKEQGRYCCRGSIHCARPQAWRIVKQALVEFPGARYRTDRGDLLGPIDDDRDGCHTCGYYRKTVTFSVASLGDQFTLAIANCSFSHKIGGFPKTIHEILREQQADAVFGRADHQSGRWPPVRVCYCAHGTKRRVQFAEPGPERKKRRL